MAKKPARIEEPVLAEGVLLSRGFYEREEKRVLTLFLKGLIVYLYTMGGIGFYLSAFNILYNKALVHTVVFVMAIFCALLYYRLLTENLGYLILLAGFAGLVYVFRRYINSGFYAVVNITVEDAAQYFGNDMKRLYNEQIGDRYAHNPLLLRRITFIRFPGRCFFTGSLHTFFLRLRRLLLRLFFLNDRAEFGTDVCDFAFGNDTDRSHNVIALRDQIIDNLHVGFPDLLRKFMNPDFCHILSPL